MKQLSYSEINEFDGRVVLFGAGDIAEKTLRKVTLNDFRVVDNSINLQGTRFHGRLIEHPSSIKVDEIVVICSTALTEISTQLVAMNGAEGIEFTISPILKDLMVISDLEQFAGVFYFTSGSAPAEKYGGGVYQIKLEGNNFQVNRLYSGCCYGALRKGDDLIFVDTDKGIFSYNIQSCAIKHCGDIPKGARAHGISYNSDRNCFYVTCSKLDMVIEYNETFAELRRFNLSSKYTASGTASHHCNDNISFEDSLYVTMFSSTGNWKKDCFDGCIAEFDLNTGNRLNDICRDLYMPHNVSLIEGSLHVLDSLPGHLRTSNFSIQGTFPAFTRGLAFYKNKYLIGQSKNRNYSKVIGISNNISISCGIIVFDAHTKVSRTINLSSEIGEIHTIVA